MGFNEKLMAGQCTCNKCVQFEFHESWPGKMRFDDFLKVIMNMRWL